MGPLLKFRTSAILYLVVSLVCTQLPLLNYLGYEFSVVIALLGTFVAGFLTITSVRQSYTLITNSQQPTAAVLSSFKQSLLLNLSLLIIPLAVMLTNAFFVKNCSLLEGFVFFLLIPVVSVVFSWALGFFCAVHYGWAKTAFVAIVLITFAEVLAVGYFTPAIFSYNFFYGYFPGLTYDEVLGIGRPLVLFRILTLILAAALVWMTTLILANTSVGNTSWKKGAALLNAMIQGKSVFVTAGIATLVILTWWFRGELGFDSSSRYIRKQLGERLATEHFIIFYSKESYDEDEMQWIAAEHEFRLKQISDAFVLPFKGEPKAQKIESYIYPSSEIKQRLMGAGNTNIAKPWSGQIHITKQSLDATLKHELVHVLAAPFGLPIIKASVSTGLVEGLAEAIDWRFGNRTLHQYAAAMHKAGVAPEIRGLMLFTGFASQSSSISYVLAGSFCRYLIDTYGMRKMMLLYRTNEYEALYHKSLDALITDWKGFLEGIPVAENDFAAVDVLFRRPPIFKKVCARVVAARNAEARKLLAEKNYADAQTLFVKSYAETKSYESLNGMLTSSLRLRQYDALTAALDTIISNDRKPNQFLPLFLIIGDALWGKGKLNEAHRLYARVGDANISDGLTEAALLRTHALRDSTKRQTFLKYFLSDMGDSLRLALLDSAFTPHEHRLTEYLKTRTIQRQNRHSEVVQTLRSFKIVRMDSRRVPTGRVFDESSTFGESTDATLEAFRLKMLGYSLFRLKEFEDAKGAFWQSLNFVATDVAKNEVNDWVERCEWMESNLKRVN